MVGRVCDHLSSFFVGRPVHYCTSELICHSPCRARTPPYLQASPATSGCQGDSSLPQSCLKTIGLGLGQESCKGLKELGGDSKAGLMCLSWPHLARSGPPAPPAAIALLWTLALEHKTLQVKMIAVSKTNHYPCAYEHGYSPLCGLYSFW